MFVFPGFIQAASLAHFPVVYFRQPETFRAAVVVWRGRQPQEKNGILAERYKCALKTTGDWSDYVFDKRYKVMEIKDLAEYIQKNKHLPNIPSAEETVKEGIDLGQMDAKLLGKVEELTLYIIKQQEEIDALKKEMKKK